MWNFIKQKNNTIYDLFKEVSKSDDIYQFSTKSFNGSPIYFSYYKSLIDEKKIHHHLLPYIQSVEEAFAELTDVMNAIPIEDREITAGYIVHFKCDSLSNSYVRSITSSFTYI